MPSSLTGSDAVGLSRRPLTEVFAQVADPRKPRGVRHPVATVLTLAQCAVLAGARSLVAIREWATDADRNALSRHGIDPHVVLPSESTIRRTLAVVDADGLDRRIAAWMATRVGDLAGRRVIAVDGKTMRGARRDGARAAPGRRPRPRHRRRAGAVGRGSQQQRDPGPAGPARGDRHHRRGRHRRRAALPTRDRHAHHRPAAGTTCSPSRATSARCEIGSRTCPGRTSPRSSAVSTSHGRRVRRTIKTSRGPRLDRLPRRRPSRPDPPHREPSRDARHIEVVYAICSPTHDRRPPATIAAWVQGHWGIENQLHWVRSPGVSCLA